MSIGSTKSSRGFFSQVGSKLLSGEQRLVLDTLFLGVMGALCARLFLLLLSLSQDFFLGWIAHYQPPGLASEGSLPLAAQTDMLLGSAGLWLVPVATTLGGLLAGILVYALAPEAEGHGTDAAVKAYHHASGNLRFRVVPVKMLASAITIGSGGSAGREGPTALMSAGVGSAYANYMRRPPEQRRLLMLVGMTAGLAAIFRAPIGTAFMAIEVLYSGMDFEAGALLYTLLGGAVSYAVNGLFSGYEPLFEIRPEQLGTLEFGVFPYYAMLGLLAGGLAALVPPVFYLTRAAFQRLPLPPHIKPALGGLCVGLLALKLPQVLGGGYAWMQQAINGDPGMSAQLLLILVFAKLVSFALTVGSGGSGGVFAPTLYVGAMLGGFFAHVFALPPAPFVIVGMAAVFAGAARVPMATLLMVSEMTGGYKLLMPAVLAVALCYLAQVALSRRFKHRTLYEGQVPGRNDSPAHRGEFQINILEGIKVGEAMIEQRTAEVFQADTPFFKVLERIKVSSATVFPIVDEKECLLGMFSLSDIRPIMDQQAVGSLVVAGDLGTTDVPCLPLDANLDQALKMFTSRNLDALPVVERIGDKRTSLTSISKAIKPPRGPVGTMRVIGMLTRRDLILAYHRRTHALERARQLDKGFPQLPLDMSEPGAAALQDSEREAPPASSDPEAGLNLFEEPPGKA